MARKKKFLREPTDFEKIENQKPREIYDDNEQFVAEKEFRIRTGLDELERVKQIDEELDLEHLKIPEERAIFVSDIDIAGEKKQVKRARNKKTLR